jgi:hypothetical protein
MESWHHRAPNCAGSIPITLLDRVDQSDELAGREWLRFSLLLLLVVCHCALVALSYLLHPHHQPVYVQGRPSRSASNCPNFVSA